MKKPLFNQVKDVKTRKMIALAIRLARKERDILTATQFRSVHACDMYTAKDFIVRNYGKHIERAFWRYYN